MTPGQLRQAPSLHLTSLGDEPFGKGKELWDCYKHYRKEWTGRPGHGAGAHGASVLTVQTATPCRLPGKQVVEKAPEPTG